MATVAATLAPGAGFANVTLTSWAGDAAFATAPVAGGQIEAVDTVTVSADGTVTGSDGSYTLMYISPTGASEALSYTITNPDTVNPVIDTLTATGSDPDSIDVAFNTDEGNGTAYFFASASATETVSAIKAGAQGTQTVSGTGTQSLTLTLATGTYYVHALHEDDAGNPSNILVSSAVTLEALPVEDESATVAATLTGGAGYTTATLAVGFDASTSAFQQWTGSEPAAGWQIETLTAEGYFDENGDYWKDAGVADGIQDVWVIQPDGTVTVEQFDNTGLAEAADTTPAAFSFTDVTGQPVSTVTESNIITITGVDAATDVAASITGGEYAVSTDDGATFGAYTSAATNVQLDDQIKVRVTTSASNSTGASAAFTAGGVSDTFTATTEAAQVPQGTITFGSETIDGSSISQPFSYSLSDQSSFESRIDGGAAQAATSPVVVNSLAYSQTVQIEIRAINETGSGTWSSVSHTTTAEPDTTAPVVALTGGDTSVVQGETYTPPTVTVTDDTDSDLTATSDITVDTSVIGTQTVTYSATDAAGNTGTAQHTVTIIAPIPDGIGVGYTNVINPDMTFGIATTLTDPQAGEFLLAGIIIDGTKYDLQILSWDAGTLTVKAPNDLPLSASPELTVERARVSV